jgi:sarcosine oxidase subunit beta
LDREVVVVGGGSTGSSVLYHLAKAGVQDAVLLDGAQQLGAGQTSRSTALIRTHYSTETVTKMALLSYRFFRDFGRELPGQSAGYVETGLLVGADESSVASMRQNSAMHKGMGIDSRLLNPKELEETGIEPMLSTDGFSLFAYEPNAGYAEPSSTVAGFASEAIRLGADVLTDARVDRIDRRAGGYTVMSTKGPVSCRKVVVATGVWSKPLFTRMGIGLPIRVSRHPVAVFGRPQGFRGKRPILFDFTRSAYYKPEGQELLFVGTLARSVDDSSSDSDPARYEEGITYEETESFSGSTAGAFPVMAASGTYRRGYAGLYDNTPDQHPIIDELSEYGYPGIHCVVGLSGHGFKLAPEFGRIVASLVSTGSFTDYDVSVFALRRFEEHRLLGGRYGVSTIL